VTVNAMMDTWTKQMGYPVVTIGSSDGNMATVTQSRFLQYPLSVNESMASSPYNYIWTIPLDFITQNNPNKVIKQVFSNVEGAIQWRSSDGFIKANINQKGFYRVNYDIDNWQKIINHLMIPPDTRPQILSALDRAGLLEDVFALSR
jgi:aminopeptidase N